MNSEEKPTKNNRKKYERKGALSPKGQEHVNRIASKAKDNPNKSDAKIGNINLRELAKTRREIGKKKAQTIKKN